MICPYIKPFYKFSNKTHITYHFKHQFLASLPVTSYAGGIMTLRKARPCRAIFAQFSQNTHFFLKYIVFNCHVMKRIWNEFLFHAVFMKIVCLYPRASFHQYRMKWKFISDPILVYALILYIYVVCDLFKLKKYTYNLDCGAFRRRIVGIRVSDAGPERSIYWVRVNYPQSVTITVGADVSNRFIDTCHWRSRYKELFFTVSFPARILPIFVHNTG